MKAGQEEGLLRSVALKNARSILVARQQVEADLLRARDELRVSQERLEAALRAADTGTFRWDIFTNRLDCDQNLTRLVGVEQDRRVDSLDAFIAKVHSDDRVRVGEAYRTSASKGLDLDLEFRVVWPDGTLHWLAGKGKPALDGSGRPASMTGACIEVTRLKRADEERRGVASRLQLALDAGELGDWFWDPATDHVTFSSRSRQIFGISAQPSLTWAYVRRLLYEEDRERARLAVERAIETRTDYEIEYRVRRPAGGSCWVAARGRSKHAPDGSLLGMIGVVQDITARKEAEAALRQREALLQVTFEQAPVGIACIGIDGLLLKTNQKFAEIFGYERAELNHRGVRDLAFAEENAPNKSLVRSLLADQIQQYSIERRYRRKDGELIWALATVTLIRDGTGDPKHFVGVFEDITRRRQTEEALREETHVLEVLNRTGVTLASQLDTQALLQTVTDAATELSGAKVGALFYEDDAENAEEFRLHTLSGISVDAFERFVWPRMEAFFASTLRGTSAAHCDDVFQHGPDVGVEPDRTALRSCLAVPVIARSGTPIGGLLLAHPETHAFSSRTERGVSAVAAQAAIAIDNARLYAAARKSAEERMRLLESERSARTQAERLSAAKDEFLAVLSHELRTPLSAILGWSQILRLRVADPEVTEGLEVIERNARVQTRLIEDLLDMSRITSGKLRLDVQPVMPFTFVSAAVETVRPAAEAKGVRLDLVLDPDAGPIPGDASRLQQVVWNLLSNAIKFTPRGGEVRVGLARADAHVRISVADTGSGIAPEFIDLVFERFVQADASTTRKHGGLGLGLAIVKRLVELHGGTVQARSPGMGQGTTFTVELPLSEVPRYEDPSSGPHSVPPAAGATDFKLLDLSGVRVLVVDDEPDARHLVARVLGECGAEVLTAESAQEALPIVEREDLQVLVSDIGMPEVDGFELLHRVRALGSPRGDTLPAIALTAFARWEDRTRALAAGFAVHVAKPIEPSELVATVAAVAARAGAG